MSHYRFPSCFRPISDDRRQVSGNPNLITSLYQTQVGLFSLTWSHTLLGRSLHLHLHRHSSDFAASPSFHLHLKPFLLSKKRGSKQFSTDFEIFWDLTGAKFGHRPEPESRFYIAVVVAGFTALLVGDLPQLAYKRTKSKYPEVNPVLVLRREHVVGKRIYSTRVRFGGKIRCISISCKVNGDARLCIAIDEQRVLQIKHLKWKFRGNERIEVDGVPIHVSWDVYNWLFEDVNNGNALFMFRFEDEEGVDDCSVTNMNEKNSESLWSKQSCNFGMNVTELRKMRRNLIRSARSSSWSSLSMSSASSGCSSSVMEWASMKDDELCNPTGFSLMVFAWKR